MFTAAFVDGSRLYSSCLAVHKGKIDYHKLYAAISKDTLFTCNYYGVCASGDGTRFLQILNQIGFNVKKKVRTYKRWPNWDIEIMHDLHLAAAKADKIILCTSNNDFIPAIEYFMSKGIQVDLYGINLGTRMQCAATNYTDLKDYLYVDNRRETLPDQLSGSDVTDECSRDTSGSEETGSSSP